jgi:DNA-binding Lrp family transcriptional regulator
MLSIDNAMEFSAQEKDELLLAEFAKCGVKKSDYLIVKTLPAKFTSQEFNEVNQLEANVLDLLRKDKRITPEIIAETLDIEVDSAKQIIKRLTEEGRIKIKVVKVGIDEVIERTLTEPLAKQTDKTPETLNFKIFYEYTWKPGFNDSDNDTRRNFCARLQDLDKLWSRAEIETMSRRMGYSVWDRKGGWYTEPDGFRSKECRHRWVRQIVMKKK